MYRSKLFLFHEKLGTFRKDYLPYWMILLWFEEKHTYSSYTFVQSKLLNFCKSVTYDLYFYKNEKINKVKSTCKFELLISSRMVSNIYIYILRCLLSEKKFAKEEKEANISLKTFFRFCIVLAILSVSVLYQI